VSRSTLPLLSAVLAAGLAVAAVVTAAGATASLGAVVDDSARFGAPWDALFGSEDGPDEIGSRLAGIDGVVDAARIVGTDVGIGDDPEVWTQALAPVPGIDRTAPVMISGRAPVADDEVALGTLVRERANVDEGEVVTLRVGTGDDLVELPFRVVGTTMVTDGFEPNVGDGALVTEEGLRRIDATDDGFSQVAVSVADGSGRAATLAALADEFPGLRSPFPVPLSLANAERIGGLPLWLALAAAALAAFTFGHALAVSVRVNRGELAVCRVVGFTRRQLYGAIGTHASLLGLAATAIGVVAGMAGARWGWRVVADSFGVASGAVTTSWVLVVAAAATLLVANLAAALPARRAASNHPAAVLRAE
jgi:putative ABC transport system permease protein